MEYSGNEGVLDDQGRAGSGFYGDEEEQAVMGSYLQQDEGKGLLSKPRAVQVQVEKPRHQACETMEPEALRQHFPFYNELQLIFASRMQRMLWAEAEGGGSKKKALQNLSSEEEDEEEDDNNKEVSEGDQKGTSSSRKKKMKKKGLKGSNISSVSDSLRNMKEILQGFMKQQMQMEAQWMEAYEAREKERRMKELEWRQTMEALENEKIKMDQRWREREEQRRLVEEARADKRDALVTALLNKLSRDHDL
ncbi:trihelix transcription factor GT-3b-like isoform X2 [Prosopis cineraria]|uniref:trihelix transcription factor GT-3b-like isoform X2 n=1 Tax=Prosopis cineraria TaxID=364024 RepID=UPI0024103668|nr:trihelix transcription factor GT-3b-like isoform X2 [Prosopis cineraria]